MDDGYGNQMRRGIEGADQFDKEHGTRLIAAANGEADAGCGNVANVGDKAGVTTAPVAEVKASQPALVPHAAAIVHRSCLFYLSNLYRRSFFF
jgi:hypothetical protein